MAAWEEAFHTPRQGPKRTGGGQSLLRASRRPQQRLGGYMEGVKGEGAAGQERGSGGFLIPLGGLSGCNKGSGHR